MSMLTPPGMGGKYRITGNRYPRMRRPRRRRRIALAAAGSALALSLVGWGTLQIVDIFSGGGDTAEAAGGAKGCSVKQAASPSAEARPEALPKPAEITVNVYNATTRSGLAKKTADALKKRGFRIGKVDNATAEYDKKVKAPGLLVGAPKAADGAFEVLGARLAGAKTEFDKRTNSGVDLIIGNAFKKLTPEQDALRAVAALASPAPEPTAPQDC
ncbi:MAG TPA: hypothetical protein DEQ61_07540 [Streptomyces sp.]|nr:hypothetical protein [Streptomyces sp.]